MMKKSAALNIDLNNKNSQDRTAFHLACCAGHLEIAEMMMKKSSKLKIDLNSKDQVGRTAFHLVCCESGHIRIADMMMEQSESLELDLKAEDSEGRTGYQLARCYRKTDVVNLIQTKMPSLATVGNAHNRQCRFCLTKCF